MQYAYAEDIDSDNVLLMANIEQTNMWYLYSGCSNHTTGNKTWFIKLDESIEKVIKFTDGRHITSGRKGDIYVVRRMVEKSVSLMCYIYHR